MDRKSNRRSSFGGENEARRNFSRESGKPSAAQIEHYLKGIEFPSSKEDLVSHAEGNDAPEEVMRVLDQLEENDYNSVIDISKQLSRIQPGRSRRSGSRGPSPATVEHYLKGIEFPANTDEIIAQAEENSAPEEIINLLEQFGDHDYYSAIDISREMSSLSQQRNRGGSKSGSERSASSGRGVRRQASQSRSSQGRRREEEYEEEGGSY